MSKTASNFDVIMCFLKRGKIHLWHRFPFDLDKGEMPIPSCTDVHPFLVLSPDEHGQACRISPDTAPATSDRSSGQVLTYVKAVSATTSCNVQICKRAVEAGHRSPQ